MKRLILPGFLALACVAACSTTDELVMPDPVLTGPVISRPYNTARGGVQITAIYFHQDSNQLVYGLLDEWIVLQSDRVQAINGWKLNAGDAGQDYALPDTLHRRLTIYTHTGRGAATDTTLLLGLSGGKWIWNNSDPDTAWVLDDKGMVVDSLSYTAKK
jgi:hypothetical protein